MFGRREDEIVMQYPVIEGNVLCDGREHVIRPRLLREFYYEGGRYYAMSYDDLTMHARGAFTILVEEGGRFYKVPLRDYNGFNRIARGEGSRNVGLEVLEGVTYIGTKEPVDSIVHINEVRAIKKPNIPSRSERKEPPRRTAAPGGNVPQRPSTVGTKPAPQVTYDHQAAIIVYVGDDNNFYITIAAAHQLFDHSLNEFDQTPAYRLTLEQLLYIKEHFHIRWDFINVLHRNRTPGGGGNGPIVNLNQTPMERLANALHVMADENKIPPYNLIGRFIPVHYVAVDADDKYVFRGETDQNLLAAGLTEYRSNGINFVRVENPVEIHECQAYLMSFMGIIEDYHRAQTEEARNMVGNSVSMDTIPDYIGRSAIYRFVGRWPKAPIADNVHPSEYEQDPKETLSSCLFGYIDSICERRLSEGLRGQVETFNIRELKEASYRRQ